MKVYISGKITGNPNYQREFAEAEKRLTDLGHTVINPAKKNDGFTYKEYIDLGLNELMRCDAIYLLDGWENSIGARLEYIYALTVDLKIIKGGQAYEKAPGVKTGKGYCNKNP